VADCGSGKAVIWTATQNPQAVQETVAAALHMDKKDVVCHVTLLGGGFGRKSKPDYVAEAAILSQKAGRPVKVVWSREEDIRFDYYNTVAAMYFKAALGDHGKPVAWLQRSVFPPITSIFDVNAVYGDPVTWPRDGWTCLSTFLTSARRTVRQRRLSASAGSARWPIFIMPSASSPSSTSLQPVRTATEGAAVFAASVALMGEITGPMENPAVQLPRLPCRAHE